VTSLDLGAGGPRNAAGDALTSLVLESFELVGAFLGAAERIAAGADITAAWWQVMGAVVEEPRTVSQIARRIGLRRQSVQRTADIICREGLTTFVENPADRRARCLRLTDEGHARLRLLIDDQAAWANAVGAQLGADAAARLVALEAELVEVRHAARAVEHLTAGAANPQP
jgi:DNA-binding MarR family transcriptional regulator